jgi:integrase/recombinase XerD
MAELRDRMQQDLKNKGRTPTTIRHYLGCVQAFVDHFQGRSPMTLGQREIRLFADHLDARKLSAQRVSQYLAAIKLLYVRTLGRPQEVAWIAFPRVKQRLPDVLARSEVARLLDAIKSPTVHAIASVCYGAGLRIDEACRLRTCDVLSKRGWLYVRRGKGGRSRYAKLSPALLVTLREYWKNVRPSGEFLFPCTQSGGAFRPSSVRKAIHRAARAAQLPMRVTPHMLRHSFATHLLEMDVDIRVIQQLLGHKDIRAPALYAQVTSALIARTPNPLDVLRKPEAEILG